MAFPVGENDQEVIVFLCNKDLAQPLCSDTCCITGCSLPRPCILQVLYTNPCSHTQLLYASFFSMQRIPFKMEKWKRFFYFFGTLILPWYHQIPTPLSLATYQQDRGSWMKGMHLDLGGMPQSLNIQPRLALWMAYLTAHKLLLWCPI